MGSAQIKSNLERLFAKGSRIVFGTTRMPGAAHPAAA